MFRWLSRLRESSRERSGSAGASASGAPARVGSVVPTSDSSVSANEPTRVTGSGGVIAPETERPAIAGFDIHAEIHRGGQGVVYRATQLGTKRQVALKVLLEGPFAGEMTRRRFEREVELAASLRHPYIVTILDSGLSHGRYYFAMEYIDGRRLDQHLVHTQTSVRDTLELFARVCEAVNFAHQRGVIHRDLKPSNILVDAEGLPHVLDFGLAKPARQVTDNQTTVQMLSTSGQLLGTLAYMSPEQAAGNQDVDIRSDVYSLGVIFYEALLGQPPYAVTGALADVLQRIAHDEPTAPRLLRGKSRFGRLIDDELETILLKALEKEPARRYQSVADLGRDLRRYLSGEPIEAKRASGFYVLRKTLRRYRVHATVAGLMLLMLIAFLIGLALLYTRESAARASAAGAAERERVARQEAERSTQAALDAAERLRRALTQQKVQRADLALARGDLSDARDDYWSAFSDGSDPAVRWALRQYYLQTGERGAVQLYHQSSGPVRFSPDGRLAVLADTPASLALRDTQDASTVDWWPTPREVFAASVNDDGVVTAAGAGWLRVWRRGCPRPTVSALLPEDSHPVLANVSHDGRFVLVIDEFAGGNPSTRAFVLDGATGQRVGEPLQYPGVLTGRCDFSPTLNQVALPRRNGVLLLTLDASGKLTPEILRMAAARAVRYVTASDLAVLTDTVDLVTLTDPGRGAVTRLLDPEDEWDLLDVRPAAQAVLLARRDGNVALFHRESRLAAWRVSRGGIEHGQLAEDGAALTTLDSRGNLTRWQPGARQEQIRQVMDRSVARWLTASNGSCVLMSDVLAGVYVYAPEQSRDLLRVAPPARFQRFAERDQSLAISGDGRVAALLRGNRLTLVDVRNSALRALRWDDPSLPMPMEVALSGDGSLLAVLSRSPAGEKQSVGLFRVQIRDGETRVPTVQTVLEAVGEPVRLVGSAVRAIQFIPGGQRLLVVRANGSLLSIDPPGVPATQPAAGVRELVTLEHAPTVVALSQDGQLAAVASENNLIRLVRLADGHLYRRLSINAPVSTLGFNHDSTLLLVRTTDGGLSIIALDTAAPIANWQLPRKGETPLATWLGPEDRMLVTYDGAVYEHQYSEIDALLAANRGYWSQREISELLNQGSWALAWDRATALEPGARRRALQIEVAVAALQRGVILPPKWIETLTADAPVPTLVRLAHAAYDARRFPLAQTLLRKARADSQDQLDAYALHRLADCEYLGATPAEAVALYAAVESRADYDPLDVPTTQLKRLMALVLAGRGREALDLRLEIGRDARSLERTDPVALASARVIASFVLEVGGESLVASGFEQLVKNFAERSLLFEDDSYFFAGELARLRNDASAASANYQRCIDTARDTWPSDWARYRLAQISAKTPATNAP